jgi:hypothetical protein
MYNYPAGQKGGSCRKKVTEEGIASLIEGLFEVIYAICGHKIIPMVQIGSNKMI